MDGRSNCCERGSQEGHHAGSPHGESHAAGQARHHDHAHDEARAHEGHHSHLGHREHHLRMMEDFKRRLFLSVVLTVPILILSPSVREFLGFGLELPFRDPLLLLLSASIFAYGGKPFLTGLAGELRAGKPGMMTLVGLAISVAFFYSSAVVLGLSGRTFFWELATLIDVMLLGHYVEMRSVIGASEALEELASLMPSMAHLIEDGGIRDVSVDSLRPGHLVLVRPGERIPADGEVVEGESSVDESLLTGESVPVRKAPGSGVIGGSLNIDGSLKVRVTGVGRESYLSQIIDLVRRAQESRSRTQDLADRAALVLTVVAVIAGSLAFIAWLLGGSDIAFALERMVTVMVTTCPHALGLAVPLVVASSTSAAARRGILIRNRDAFERARDLRVIVFDKTGTLTEGRFEVTGVIPSSEEVLRLAASLERHSGHPVAEAIVREAESRGLEPLEVEGFENMPGRGVRGKVGGREVMVIGPAYAAELGVELPAEARRLMEEGNTISLVLVDGKLLGVIALADRIRPESFEAVEGLRRLGLRVHMLTGDDERVARRVALELGLDGYRAGVLPEEKARVVSDLRVEGKVAMVGDGINDAPALVEADLGVAIGAGTHVAIESADVVLVRNDPRDMLAVMELARRTHRKMKENLAWAAGYNVIAIPMAAGVMGWAGVIISPAVGALLMSLSTVIVAVNARLI